MKELWDFYKQTQQQFSNAIEVWQKESTGLTEVEEAMNGDYLVERRDTIESLLDTGHTLGLVALYTFLERFLNRVLEHLRAGGAPIPDSKQGFSLHQLRDHLMRHAHINLASPPFKWSDIEQLREVRNCVVHADGWITVDFALRLDAVGTKVKEDTPLKLPKKYFERCWMLVNETYQVVHAECWKQFGYGKQQELWLRPTRTFTSEQLRRILTEATNAGIAAREAATKRLVAQAKKERRRSEDSCGWVWLELDPKLLKHIHKLKLPNIDTSSITPTILEDFKLYLKNVSDYMRMSASFCGIEAAAAVLEKHGIRSRVESLAD